MTKFQHYSPLNLFTLHFEEDHCLLSKFNKWASARDIQQCGMCDQQSLRSACAYAQSDQSLCLLLEYSMTFRLLIEHHLEFLSLKGGCEGLCESTFVEIPHCWKSHVTAQIQKYRSRNVSGRYSLSYGTKSIMKSRLLCKTQDFAIYSKTCLLSGH